LAGCKWLFRFPHFGSLKMAYFGRKFVQGGADNGDRAKEFGVPVIDVGGKIIIGFDKRKLDEYLGL
jgi:hypothetical protein